MTLLEKLNEITKDMGALTKTGTNSFHRYNYVKAEDSMKQFRELELKYKIKVLPVIQEKSLTVIPHGDGIVTTFVIDYNIADLESKESYRVSLPAQGYDGTDKSVFKAMTGGFKYFLLQTFSYSSDDPEKDEVTPTKENNSFRKTSRNVTTVEMKENLPAIMENSDKDVLTTMGANTGTQLQVEVKGTTVEVKSAPTTVSNSRFTVNKTLDATPIAATGNNGTGNVRFSKGGFSSFSKKAE